MGLFRISSAMFLAAFALSAQAPKGAWTPTWRAPGDYTASAWRDDASQTGGTGAQTAPPRPVAVDYSDGYRLRNKIHRYASYATLPLFAAEFAVGQRLYNGGSESLRSAHSGLAGGLAGLFGLNTATGVWNMVEARKDPNGRRRRLIHGILMLGADAGFVATAALAPDDDDEDRRGAISNNRSRHRTVALTSMGVAAASYIYMLVTR